MRLGPHYFFGLTWPELSAVVGTIAMLMSLFLWLTHETITKPMQVANQSLQKSIDALTKKVEGIGGSADIIHREHDHRLDDHDVHLARHDEEIKTLFERTDKEERNHEN